MDPINSLLRNAGTPRPPDFYGIGAEKCGTTWLWDMFRTHPQIGVPVPKELRYFAGIYLGTGMPDLAALRRFLNAPMKAANKPALLRRAATELRMMQANDEAYLRIFGAFPEQVVGDISPMYCTLPHAGFVHMRRVSPDAKIIFLLRDPVDRAISGGKMKAREKHGELTHENVRKHSLIPFQVQMSRYSKTLATVESVFGEDRIFVGFIDDIKSKPLGLLEDICRFLGVEYKPDYFPDIDKRSNEGGKFTVDPALKEHLHRLLADEYEALERLFPERVAAWRAREAGKS